MAKSTGLAAEQLGALDRLKTIRGIGRFYLAGGSAIAFHLGHRVSRDLDLFSRSPKDDLEIFREAAEAHRDISIVSATDVAIKLLVRGVEVDAVCYPYPPLKPPAAGPRGILVADLQDLAAMKLAAISRRGLRRDFWDLQVLLASGMSLVGAFRAFVKRFGKAESDLYHVLRALTYFGDAEAQQAFPEGLSRKKWAEIKAFFEHAGATVLHELSRSSLRRARQVRQRR